MRWTWALLCLAGGRAETTRNVVEDFATTTGLWTDTGQVLGLPESVQPIDKRRVDDDNVPDFEPGSDGRCHDLPDRDGRRTFSRQRSTLQSFRHLLPPRSLSPLSTQSEAFRRMPSRSGGSSMRSVGTISTLGSPPRRSSSTASARSARLFLGPRSLGSE